MRHQEYRADNALQIWWRCSSACNLVASGHHHFRICTSQELCSQHEKKISWLSLIGSWGIQEDVSRRRTSRFPQVRFLFHHNITLLSSSQSFTYSICNSKQSTFHSNVLHFDQMFMMRIFSGTMSKTMLYVATYAHQRRLPYLKVRTSFWKKLSVVSA